MEARDLRGVSSKLLVLPPKPATNSCNSTSSSQLYQRFKNKKVQSGVDAELHAPGADTTPLSEVLVLVVPRVVPLESLLTVSRRQQDQQLDQQQRGAHVLGPTHAAPHPCSPLENLTEPPRPRKPSGILVIPRACVRCSYTFTLRRAPLYASDRRARAHRGGQAGGGDVTAQPAVPVFIFHFRGGSFGSSGSDC